MGFPLVNGSLIRSRIAEARRHASAGRWVAARRAYDDAEHMVELGRPTLRRALERERQERDAEALTAALAAVAAFRKGKKRGATDPLGRVLADILSADPRMHSKDVLAALKAKTGDGIVVAVRSRQAGGYEILWRDPANGERVTSWFSVRNRLTALRRARLLDR